MPCGILRYPSGIKKIKDDIRWMSSFPLYFRRKYFTGEAYITRRKAYITALRSKAISLRGAHIPMRIALKGGFLRVGF